MQVSATDLAQNTAVDTCLVIVEPEDRNTAERKLRPTRTGKSNESRMSKKGKGSKFIPIPIPELLERVGLSDIRYELDSITSAVPVEP